MSKINRRGFLKLFGMGLVAAGVSTSTVSAIFPAEEARGEEPDKMAVAVAIRKIVERQKATGKTRETALEALRILSEAHRDFSLVWAGAGLTLYVQLGGSLPDIVLVARENRRAPIIKEFLSEAKKVLLVGPDEAGHRCRLDTGVAYGEMVGFSPSAAYMSFQTHDPYSWEWYRDNDPSAMAEAFGLSQKQLYLNG